MEEASEFAERFARGKGVLPLITTCCPSWVDFMEKFHGDMVEHFSSCKSPHAIVGTLCKTWFAQQRGLDPAKIRMISVMPCTSKKYEISRSREMFASGHQDVDISLTTREITRMIRQAGIDFAGLPEEAPDAPFGQYSGAATIFGQSGGVMEAALRSAHYLITGAEMEQLEFEPIRGLAGVKEMATELDGRPLRVAVAHGLKHVETVLERIRQAKKAGEEPPYHFIEVMACPGGCVGGGGQSWGVNDELRRKRAEGLSCDDRSHQIRRSHQNPAVRRLYDDFLGSPLSEKAKQLLHTSYEPLPEYRR
jgi:NADH-quinone oxidoreductase subunit G